MTEARTVFGATWKSSQNNRIFAVGTGLYPTRDRAHETRMASVMTMLKCGFVYDGSIEIVISGDSIISYGIWGTHGTLGAVLVLEGPIVEAEQMNGEPDFDFPCPYCGTHEGIRGRAPGAEVFAFRYKCGCTLVFGGEKTLQKITDCKEKKDAGDNDPGGDEGRRGDVLPGGGTEVRSDDEGPEGRNPGSESSRRGDVDDGRPPA